MGIEYVEDYAKIEDGWGDLLNHYGEDEWELLLVVDDELDADGKKHPGRKRLIFARHFSEEDDDEQGEPS